MHRLLTDRRLITALFIILGLATFGGTLGNDFVSLDDLLLILNNEAVNTFDLVAIWNPFTPTDPELYAPVTQTLHAVSYALFGDYPMPYHLLSIVLHIANALLTAALISRLSKNTVMGIFGGLLFLTHPLHTEAVAWASALKDVLSAFFVLLSLIAYFEYARNDQRRNMKLSLAFYICALLSKVSVAPLPVLLLVIDRMEGRTNLRHLVREKKGFWVAMVTFVFIALAYKTGRVENPPVLTTMLLGCKALALYAWKLLLPSDLRPLYIQEAPVGLTIEFLLPVMFCTTLCFVAWRARKRRSWHALFAVSMFVIMIVPSFMNILKNDTLHFASDRYAYIASIGFIYGCLRIAYFTVHRWNIPAKTAGAIGVLTIVSFMILTRQQAVIWSNSLTLFTHVITYHPTSVVARDNRGAMYTVLGMDEDALQDFEVAAQQDPDNPNRYKRMGEALIRLGQWEQVVQAYETALDLGAETADVYFGLGTGYLHTGRQEDAERAFTQSALLDREYFRLKMMEVQGLLQ